MKNSFYKLAFSLFVCLILATVSSCRKSIDDLVKEQEKNSVFYPRIFDTYAVFVFPNKTISQGDSIRFEGLVYSPVDKVSIEWKVDGKDVSKNPQYTFIASDLGVYEVRLTVSYNGNSSERVSNVTVQ
jgi:hypothetical protein